MSLLPIAECTVCKLQTTFSVPCSNCCHTYCAGCFGMPNDSAGGRVRLFSLLSVRLCFRCKTVKQEETSEVEQEQCSSHGRHFRLFCFTCEALLCDDCFLLEGAHMRHKIDFVDAVYKERRANADRMLTNLQKLQNPDVTLCEKNLESILVAERSISEDAEAIYQQSKQNVKRIINARNLLLRERMELPAKRRKLNDDLYRKVTQLPRVEFFKKQASIHRQCDELISCIASEQFVPTQFDDIGCELVPSYKMYTCTLTDFHSSLHWSQNWVTISDIAWNISLRKDGNIFLKVEFCDDTANRETYKLLVIVPHEDIRKTIRKTYFLNGESGEETIASVALLLKENFINSNGDLVVTIGIRPTNIVTENRVLKVQTRELQDKINQLEKELSSSEIDLRCKFYIMHFNLSISKQLKKNQVAHHSSPVSDRSSRQWCLRVYPMDDTDANLRAYVVLRQGTPTRCRYFIELIHNNPNNSLRFCTEIFFERLNEGHGWHHLATREKLLSDIGYYPNQVLRFRFGVQPIDD
ncbi:uncharacterized protein LOC129780040 [Toxorhynchites rutilus septentrionalis]|uniref:uncharacterized protein LOC129780040 n=1 Tax=Toxorhynchites rutilus septentrionalis TaxID=329112 RepID=UPI002478E7A7|nr:uncharacterized protein LOC129780040 [Toxorhynchites rutilus septentrionalis]